MAVDLSRPEYYINRELSWLDFNRRVMEEARDERNPLLERVRFLGIVAGILDEFFEVRVAGILQVQESGRTSTGPDRLTPEEQLAAISRKTHELVAAQYRCWNEELLPALAAEKIHLHEVSELRGDQLAFIRRYWRGELEPILTPIVIDPAHPFPRVLNKALCIGVLLEQDGKTAVGVVTVPRVLPRILALPDGDDGAVHMVTLAGIVAHYLKDLFEGYGVTGYGAFRVTRNSELYVNEEEADNLLEEIAESLEKRRKGDVVRLEIEEKAPERLVRFLMAQFEVDQDRVYTADGPVNLNRISTIYSLVNRPELKDRPFTPLEVNLPAEPDRFFESLRARDVLLHHPYESFNSVIDFIRMAVRDPRVLAIKQTLYRTGEDSQVVQALMEAADLGKEVAVLVELKARFDEAFNIEWAKQLEESGVHVVYGLLGMKTHCKLSMVVRRDEDQLRRYVHLGTGNYNHVTARLYTDLGLLTARDDITREVAEVFNLLTARSEETFRKLMVAPTTMMAGFLRRIDREMKHARAGRPAAIVAKMNGLTDPKVIRALYRASMARRRDRPRRARHLLPAAGPARHQRAHPRAQHHRPLPGAQPRVLLRQRRRSGDLDRQRRLDEPQPAQPRGGRLPRGGGGHQGAPAPLPAAVPGRPFQDAGLSLRRPLRPPRAAERGARPVHAGGPHGHRPGRGPGGGAAAPAGLERR